MMLYINEVRGDVIEARHRVHAVVYHNNNIELQLGNSELVVPMRSIAKPLMLRPLLSSCKQNSIQLTNDQISVMASSHNGEEVHRATVLSLLKLSDSSVLDLECGTHLPYFSWLYEAFFSESNISRRQLFHNCSGKHAGMLLLAKLNGFTKRHYWQIEHPAQQLITYSVKKIMNINEPDPFYISLDGCGVPTYCTTIKKIALTYRALYNDERLCPIGNAILSEPYFIAGRDRVETDIIKNCGFIAKSGSSGLFSVACPEYDISIVLKIEDGNDEAAESAIVEILDKLGLINEYQRTILQNYRTIPIYTSTRQLAGCYHSNWINE
jgi:L-asparaginase II